MGWCSVATAQPEVASTLAPRAPDHWPCQSAPARSRRPIALGRGPAARGRGPIPLLRRPTISSISQECAIVQRGYTAGIPCAVQDALRCGKRLTVPAIQKCGRLTSCGSRRDPLAMCRPARFRLTAWPSPSSIACGGGARKIGPARSALFRRTGACTLHGSGANSTAREGASMQCRSFEHGSCSPWLVSPLKSEPPRRSAE